MQIKEFTDIVQDMMQPGAFIGGVLVASGIQNSIIIYHGYLGCNIEAIHMRSDSIPGGFYTPIVATGLNESDSIYGGYEKLKTLLQQVAPKNYDHIWIITGDATSIIADDIHGVAQSVDIPQNTQVISLDVPGFLGGIAKGTDVSISKILDNLEVREKKQDSLLLLAPHLMGIKSHPYDYKELQYMLNGISIQADEVLSCQLTKESLNTVLDYEYMLPLTWENMPGTMEICKKSNIKYLLDDYLLPVGIANTEEWLLNIAKLFNKEALAKTFLNKEKEIILKQLKYNYNFSWLSTLYTEKTCSIYANSQFAVSLAKCLFYDFNIKPKVIAILAETPEAIEKAKKSLQVLSEYVDFELLINPDYYSYIKSIKAQNVDFAIGSIQDKPLCVAENIAHMSLSGFYFFNNFNFIPWPYLGLKGVLSIATELGFLMEKAFYYEGYWKEFKYKPSN